MENKEKAKAKEIAIKLMGGGDRNIQPLVDALIEMTSWKDEQFTKEKQQLIEKACGWLKDNIDDYFTVSEGEFEEWFNEMFNDFKKAMENGLNNSNKILF